MNRYVVRIALLGLTAALVACAEGGGRAKMSASVSSDTGATADSSSTAWSGSSGTTTAAAPGPSSAATAGAPAPAPAAPEAAPVASCPVVCNIANRGRMAAADEARFSAALASQTSNLRACMRGRTPWMTLRFDSSKMLTHFGVDVDNPGEGEGMSDQACVDSVNGQKPTIDFAGPSTVRCAERCRR